MRLVPLLALLCAGCGPKHIPVRDDRFFVRDSCNEVVPAKPDGYKHFLCTDVSGQQWEVAMRAK